MCNPSNGCANGCVGFTWSQGRQVLHKPRLSIVLKDNLNPLKLDTLPQKKDLYKHFKATTWTTLKPQFSSSHQPGFFFVTKAPLKGPQLVDLLHPRLLPNSDGSSTQLMAVALRWYAQEVSEKSFGKEHLVAGFNPFEKYARQIGSFLQVGMNIKHVWNHHLGI